MPHNILLYLTVTPFFYHDQQTLQCAVSFLKTKLISWQYLFEVIWDLGKDTLFIYFWYVRKNAYKPVVRFCVFRILFVYWSYFGIFKIWWKYRWCYAIVEIKKKEISKYITVVLDNFSMNIRILTKRLCI